MRAPTPASALDPVVRAIRDADRLAVDTEFHAERRYLPSLKLVQIGLPDGEVHLLDPLEEGVMETVAEALRSTTWVVHGGRQDLRILEPLLGGLPEHVFDTQVAAGLVGPSFPASYESLVERWLGRTIDKGCTMSDWSRRPLREEQLRYAACDVELLLGLWDRLAEAAADHERTAILEHACDHLRDRAIQLESPDEAWRALGASKVLTGPSLPVLQEICAWREEVAREKNQPARSVLSDGLAVDLARRRPSSVNRILSNRRFPKRLAQRLGDELLDRIRRAESRPAWGWPRVIAPQTEEARLFDVLRVTLDLAGVRDHWSRRLLAPERLLEDILLIDLPDGRDPVERLPDWTHPLLADPLLDALAGRLRVRILPARTASGIGSALSITN